MSRPPRRSSWALAARLTAVAAGLGVPCDGPAWAAPASPTASAFTPVLPPDVRDTRHHLRLQGAWALGRNTSFDGDGHFRDMADGNAGLDLDYASSLGRVFNVGVGARYSYGRGPSADTGLGHESEHWAFLPLMLGWRGGSERITADLTFGVGPALGALTWGALPGHDHAWAYGAGAELAPTFTFKIAERLGLTFGFAARVLVMSLARSGVDPSLAGGAGVHGELTARAGVAVDL